MKAVILYNRALTEVVHEVVGMREDGTWAGLSSSAQFDSSHRNRDNVFLKSFEDSQYSRDVFHTTILKWLREEISESDATALSVFYFLPQFAQKLGTSKNTYDLIPFRKKIELEKKFGRFVVKEGWSICQLPRLER